MQIIKALVYVQLQAGNSLSLGWSHKSLDTGTVFRWSLDVLRGWCSCCNGSKQNVPLRPTSTCTEPLAGTRTPFGPSSL